MKMHHGEHRVSFCRRSFVSCRYKSRESRLSVAEVDFQEVWRVENGMPGAKMLGFRADDLIL